MSKIKIISDSTTDLSPELIKRYNITIVPLYVNLGGEVLKDGADVTPEDIYKYVDKTNILPGTIACSIEDFKVEFLKYKEQGYEIICHTISSDMSCTYNNAILAAGEVGGGVYVVDTRNLSTGGGHVLLQSAILAESGMAAEEIVKTVTQIVPKVRASFILDNLDYMKKGGRCSGVMALGANLLKIKPTIIVENGVMKVGQKFRGTMQKVLTEYVDSQLEGRKDQIRPERIFITHTACTGEFIDIVKERINLHMHFDEITETIAGGTITSHCGPNTLGILFIEK